MVNSSACFHILFDLTRKITFNNLLDWNDEVSRGLREEVPSILLGNKSDLIDEYNMSSLSQEEISEMKEVLSFSYYFETSAKENTGIHKAFTTLAKILYLTYSCHIF